MPITVERLSSREASLGQNPARILRYHVDGTNDNLHSGYFTVGEQVATSINNPVENLGGDIRVDETKLIETPTGLGLSFYRYQNSVQTLWYVSGENPQ